MKSRKFTLFFSFLAFGLVGLVQPEPLPELPKFFTTNLMVNAKKEIRSAGKAYEQFGVTFNAFEAADETLGLAVFELSVEANFGSGSYPIREWMIRNPFLEGVKSFFNVYDFAGFIGCQVDSTHKDSILDDIFGIDPENPSLPSISHMLHFGAEYTLKDKGLVLNIPSLNYEAKVTVENIKAEFEILYSWSDIELWQGSAGENVSVPVQAIVRGKIDALPEHNGTVFVDSTIVFENFKVIEPNYHLFYPPNDIWCSGRNATVPLKSLPTAFSYDNEVIIHYAFPEKPPIDAILKIAESYDFRMRASRSEYKPLDFSQPDDPFNGNAGFVAAVKDFQSGVEYVTNQVYGNCSAEFIGFDMSGDIQYRPDGTVNMMSPFHMWNLDRPHAFNGFHYDRGILMISFIALIEPFSPLKEGSPMANYTSVIEVTGGNYAEWNDTGMEKGVPVKFQFYPTNEYSDKRFRVMHNIIGLRETRPAFNTFDITQCFTEGSSMATKTIKFPWSEKLVMAETDPWEFEHIVRRSIHHAAHITTMRVQNMKLHVESDEGYLYVSFSIVDWPSYLNKTHDSRIPPESTLSLEEALEFLKQNITAEALKIVIPGSEGSEEVEVVAVKNFFENGEHEHVMMPIGGYSPGAMAGLGISMLILSFAGGLALFVFVIKW